MYSDKEKSASNGLDYNLNYQQNDNLSAEERLHFLYPCVNENATPLPRNLSLTDKSIYTNIDSTNPLRLEYTHVSTVLTHYDTIYENACVRADYAIPKDAGIYYFEIKVLSKGVYGRAYIGLKALGTNLQNAPGWDLGTYAYHGDDGKKFASGGDGVPYGPTYSTNDVVGCGVNFNNRTCFFTLNGLFLGMAFCDMHTTNLYPTVGVGSKNEAIEVNFGQRPFVYNIKMEMILDEANVKDLLHLRS